MAEGYMFNDSALFLTGAMALSQSAYVSWGAAVNDSTTVGFTQNANGTLLFKDNATGSWTELGNSLDNTILGDASSDIITVNGQLTASVGGYFADKVGIGTASPAKNLHVYGASGEVELRMQSGDKYSSIIQKDNAELIIQNASNGHIMFYDDTAERMRIDNDGKVGIGAVPDELLHLKSSTSAKPVLLIENTNADAVASELKFLKSTTDEAAKDDIGKISFYGNDAANSESQMAWILGENWTVDSGAEEGALHFGVASAGANSVSTLSLLGQGTAKTTYAIFGDPWEGNTTTNVGIGVADPDALLEILSTSTQQKWSYDTDSFATLTVADSSHTTLATGESGNLTLDSAGDIILDPAGSDVLPPSDNTVNLGSASKRWDHIHTVDITTGDLHMKNDRGDWTIVEEENYLCVVNNRTNKRYKMMLEEIED